MESVQCTQLVLLTASRKFTPFLNGSIDHAIVAKNRESSGRDTKNTIRFSTKQRQQVSNFLLLIKHFFLLFGCKKIDWILSKFMTNNRKPIYSHKILDLVRKEENPWTLIRHNQTYYNKRACFLHRFSIALDKRFALDLINFLCY